MALTTERHADLKTRLEGLVGEFAPASDRAGAVKKLHAVLEGIPVSDEAPLASDDAVRAKQNELLDELDRLEHANDALKAAKIAVDAELATTKEQLAAAQALLEEASKAVTPATPAADNHQQ